MFLAFGINTNFGKTSPCPAVEHVNVGRPRGAAVRPPRDGHAVRRDLLIAPASLEALNALNSQNVDYIKYINSAGLHALNTLIQPAGIH